MKIFFSTRSTTQDIDGNTDNKGRKKKKFEKILFENIFFSPLNRLPNRQTNISTEILSVERKKNIPNFLSTTQLIDGNTDKGRTNLKKKNLKFFFFSTGSTTQHDGNTDNKGREQISKKKF